MVAPIVLAGAFAMIALGTSPIQRMINQPLNILIPNEILDPASLIEANAFGLVSDKSYRLEMKKHGFNHDRAKRLKKIAMTKLSPLDLIQLRRRGLITEKDFIKQIEMSRTDEKTVKQIEELSEFIPSVQDTIQFAVREGYREDIAETQRYDEDFPSNKRIREIELMDDKTYEKLKGSDRLIGQALQIGLKPQLLKIFWRIHWQLPSVSAGLEMFHRLRPEFNPTNPVTFETIKELLEKFPQWIYPLAVEVPRSYPGSPIRAIDIVDLALVTGYVLSMEKATGVYPRIWIGGS
ncbi:hypothetical protein LCGC14_2818870, partial [marine sediment metagenome]